MAGSGGGMKPRKASGPSVTNLLTKAAAAYKERNGMSLAALKKVLAAGHDVEKSNSEAWREKVMGSFKLNKKQQEGEAGKMMAAEAESSPALYPNLSDLKGGIPPLP